MIEILESSLVVPSRETPMHTIWLSNLDLLVARTHTPTVYFYRFNGDSDFFVVEPLKSALGNVLVHFYPLAGRLVIDQTGSGRPEINCTAKGVLFVVARSDLTLDDFGDFKPSDEMRKMLVPVVESSESSCILAMFQVTFFKCGGVCLGAAIHHTAADGLAALHFINTWSGLVRCPTNDEIATPPFVDRTLLRARSPPIILYDHLEYSPKLSATEPKTNCDFLSAILKLTKDQIKHLKNISSSNLNGKPISTFKAIVAHIWRSACKARSLEPGQQTRLLMTADARSRVQPKLPLGYLGNSIFRKSAMATAGEILTNGIEFGASKISEVIDQLDDEFVRSVIDYLELLHEEHVVALHKGKWVMSKSDLWVISWQGLPIYDADFGWGKPVFMGRACLQFSGLVYIMPEAEERGGLIVAVALEPENMEGFKRVFYEELGVL